MSARVVPARSLEAEPAAAGLTAWVLAALMFLAPAVGVPHEELLQDTLKSMLASFAALGGLLVLAWQLRHRHEPLRWHHVVWLPLTLCAYALGSMAWSHAYLGGAEAVRWFVFAVLAWLALNALGTGRLARLAWGIHLGAVAAAVWTALQFWADLRLFPQGPNPASTFVNRNFYAEFVVCTLPFGALLLAQARQPRRIAALAMSLGFVVTTIFMTGTRAALIALGLQALVVWPLVLWRFGKSLEISRWTVASKALAACLAVATIVVLGAIPCGNPKLLEEGRGTNALQRAVTRAQSIRPADESLGLRMLMWKATGALIADRPFAGVGAGAWEVEMPRYQAEGSQLETDYYVHNEFLQLVAEYGVVGWTFLALLLGWLSLLAWRTWQATGPPAEAEGAWRATLLCSLLALMVVSCIGFPWRMAATGALFAVCLGALAASEVRLGRPGAAPLPWSTGIARGVAAAALVLIALAAFISWRAAESESKLVRAAKMALAITASGNPNDPKWVPVKAEMLRLTREGIALNPHYRKITPMVADELARWGDWANATWIWESVLASRPYVVALITNAARGHLMLGEAPQGMALLERAKSLQPRAPSVVSLEVIALARTGQMQRALELARQAVADRYVEYDLLNAAYHLGVQQKDFVFARQAMELRASHWPATRLEALMHLGRLNAGPLQDGARAEAAFREALRMLPREQRLALLEAMPAEYRARLAQAAAAP